MSEPSISITRFTSCDRLVTDDLPLLDGLLRASATRYAGSRLGPIGLQLPFSKVCSPRTGYMIPPTVGDDLLANELAGIPVRVDDQRTEPTVAIRAEQVTQGIPLTRPAAAAAAVHVRGMIKTTHDKRTCIVAGLAQAVAPIAGIVLVRDLRSAKAQKETLDLYRIPSRIAGPPVPRRSTLMRVRPAGPTTDGREQWLIVPAHHRDWGDRVIPDPGILLCADPEAASTPPVLHRLFGGPNQRVYGIEATDRYYSAAEIHQMYGAFGHVI